MKVQDEKDIILSKTQLPEGGLLTDNICKTLKIDSKLFLQDLKCHGYLDREPGRVSKRVKIGQRRVTCYCVYNEPHEQNDVSVKTEKKKIKRKKA